jgi:hypothetical protein
VVVRREKGREMKVAYCQCTYDKDFTDTLECMKSAGEFVDYKIVVEDGTLTPEEREMLSEETGGTVVLTVLFQDNIPNFRNHYVRECQRLGVDWILVSDPDEHFNEALFVDIHKIVYEMESKGYNMAGINCIEAFKTEEWLDELDKLKETPGGRESSFYKNLLYKCYPDLVVEGIGETKNVHETWYSPTHQWVTCNLPKKYSYTHRKSALKIWRNAARNVFIGGGGNNVGNGNPLWGTLRTFALNTGIGSWAEFEKYVEEGKNITKDSFLYKWAVTALTFSASNWGIECRELAKWLFFYNKHLVYDEVIKSLKTLPKMSARDEVENFVTEKYFKVLGRHPDAQGLTSYTELILSGKLKKEELEQQLRSSPEYIEKFGEVVDVTIPVSVKPIMTPEIARAILSRSRIYREDIKPKMDVGEFILNQVRNREEFLKWFYSRSGGSRKMKELIEMLSDAAD